jgi:glutamate N-acetyltransferase / amino-acid N-acetyltransferase
MSVTSAQGFIAGAAAGGLRSDGTNDVAVVINQGPRYDAAAVFTKNQVKAAPVLWSEQAIKGGKCCAVVLNSGGANACTGAKGFENTHKTAEYAAELLSVSSAHIQVCSTGLIGKQLDLNGLLPAIGVAIETANQTKAKDAARAILTTDTKTKEASISVSGFTIGGMIKGAGMLAPDMATMLCVLTTDAAIDAEHLEIILKNSVAKTLNRIDSDGCTSTNDTVLLMASGKSEITPDLAVFQKALIEVLDKLGSHLIQDAEGSTKDIKIEVVNAASEIMAEAAGRSLARNNLFKTAMFGSDPNWGRILAALGAITFEFDQFKVDVKLNGVLVCSNGEALPVAPKVDLSARLIEVLVDFNSGKESATIWTNDLSEKYVYENSAYST